MHHLLLLICIIGFPCLSCAEEPPATGYENISGPGAVVARLDLLYEHLGGRQSWATAKSLYMIQRTRSPRIGDGILSSSWHDLEAPGEWGDVHHARLKVRYAWTADGGWFRKGDDYRDYIEDEIKQRLFYWQRDLYTLLHRLAEDVTPYTLTAAEPYGFFVLNKEQEKIAEFQLTRDGELYRWEMLGGKKQHKILFGPYKSFGAARFPDWMASSDGTWSAYQIQVMPSPLPFREQVSLKKPVREWQGGAVKNNCEAP